MPPGGGDLPWLTSWCVSHEESDEQDYSYIRHRYQFMPVPILTIIVEDIRRLDRYIPRHRFNEDHPCWGSWGSLTSNLIPIGPSGRISNAVPTLGLSWVSVMEGSFSIFDRAKSERTDVWWRLPWAISRMGWRCGSDQECQLWFYCWLWLTEE